MLRGQIPPHVFVQMTSEELAPKVGLQEGENGCMPLIEVGWVDAANDILATQGAACGWPVHCTKPAWCLPRCVQCACAAGLLCRLVVLRDPSPSTLLRSAVTSLRRTCSSIGSMFGWRACGKRCCRPTWRPVYRPLLLCRCARRGEWGHGFYVWCGVGGASGCTQSHGLHVHVLAFDVSNTRFAACACPFHTYTHIHVYMYM